MGAAIGRHAKRIAKGRAIVAGRDLRLEINAPPHHSHGGNTGFSTRTWEVRARARGRVVLGLRNPDGAGGYPGARYVSATH